VQPSPNVELGDEHFSLLTAATEVYHAAIFTQPRVLEYLAKRRIDLDMIRRHHIGFATGNDLAKYFRFRGWDPEIANDLGLIGPRGEYFRLRIVIPELRDGKAIYLVGRATQKYQKAKYLGLPGAPKPLYGVEQIRDVSDVYVVEGAFDWLTLAQWGYPAIALLGSHLKQEQISEIADAEHIFIVTDSDEPGRRSARQLAATFGKRARTVPPLPNAKDVNELAMRPHAQEIFAALVQRAK
jgi:DNA primase